MHQSAANQRLKRLRTWRVGKEPDLSLSFLKDQFKREVARPHQQLAELTDLWESLVPASIVARTRLESLSRGVLKVGVESSATLYELDQLLRSGLQRQLVAGCRRCTLQRVQLRIDSSLWAQGDSTRR